MKCPCCHNRTESPSDFCERCRYPVTGTDTEKVEFLKSKRLESEMKIFKAVLYLKRCRHGLYVLAAVALIFTVVIVMRQPRFASGDLPVLFLSSGIFFGLSGFIFYRSPVLVSSVCIVLALVTFFRFWWIWILIFDLGLGIYYGIRRNREQRKLDTINARLDRLKNRL